MNLRVKLQKKVWDARILLLSTIGTSDPIEEYYQIFSIFLQLYFYFVFFLRIWILPGFTLFVKKLPAIYTVQTSST